MIQVIDRVAKIVGMLAAEDDLSLEKIAGANALNRGTVCNILRSLIEVGWVERSGCGTYRLTTCFRELGTTPEWDPKLIGYLEQKLRVLSDNLCESLVISTLRYSRIVVMAQAKFQHTLMINDERLYAKLSLYRSVSGEVLCAGLPAEVRRTLFRINPPTEHDLSDDGDLAGYERKLERIYADGSNISLNERLSIKSWAFPIYDDARSICASIGLSVPLARLPEDGGARFCSEMQKTAGEISRWLHKENFSAAHLIRLPLSHE